jgi:adenylate cyclase
LMAVYIAALLLIRVPAAAATINLLAVVSLTALAAISNWLLSRNAIDNFRLERALRGEQEKTERLLHTLMPADIAERLKRGEAVADPFPAATVVFVDIVGSSAFARQVPPDRFIATLNAIFAIADRHAQLQRVEKVKTIGDAYLVVAGARGGGDAVGAVQFALGVIRDVAAFAAREDLPIGIRAGLHTGPVIGGVIGSERAIYDYWGDTMNTAARLEAAARANAIAVSEPVFRETSRVADYQPPRKVTLKGIGEFAVYDYLPEL